MKDPLKAGMTLVLIVLTADLAWNRERSLIGTLIRAIG